MSALLRVHFEDENDEPRISSPGFSLTSPGSGGVLQSWEAAEINSAKAKTVPDSERAKYAAQTTLPAFYRDCRAGRWEPIGRSGRTRGTVEKEQQALRAWTTATKPTIWSSETEWEGPTLKFLESASNDWLQSQVEKMPKACGLAPTTVNRGLRNALRTIMNHAVRVKAVSRVPASVPIQESVEPPDVFTLDEVDRIISELTAIDRELATAFALACRLGARPVDLFLLTRDQVKRDVRNRVVIELHAKKNRRFAHKSQAIPIAPVMWAMINANCPPIGMLFPSLATNDPACEDPEKTKPARRRNAAIKGLLNRLGMPREKPWQTCRATCNEIIESTKEGVGQFVLGHSTRGVNARSYRKPTQVVFDTIMSIAPLPAELRLANQFTASSDSYGGCG